MSASSVLDGLLSSKACGPLTRLGRFMRILFVPAAYYPALGGTERTTRMIAESLARRGHAVAVAVADFSSFS